MSLIGYGYNPIDRSMRRAVEELFDDDFLTHRSLFPYWRHIPREHALHTGSGIGEVENTHDKYSVTLDVCHFKPEEIKVNLNEHELVIEGDHEEKTDAHGTIKRSFVRKYFLPDDINAESIRSSLNDKGHLTIEASKKTPSLTQSRAIPITMS